MIESKDILRVYNFAYHKPNGKIVIQMDPKDLIEKARYGDKEAFGKLYELYYLPVFRYVHFRIRKKEDAQDLVQIIFIKVYESIGKYKDRGKDPLSYFFTIARNTVIDYLRKRQDLKLFENAQIEAGDKSNPEFFAAGKELKEMINKAIQTLNNDQKEVVILKFIIGLPNSEISKQMRKTEDAIRQIQHRALKLLKEKLKLYEQKN